MIPGATLHVITGKGGVGKSSMAAALAAQLVAQNEGPVLLVDVQGSGQALKILGLSQPTFENTALPTLKDAWGAKIFPRETFKQYFGLVLALGNDQSAFAQFTSGIRSKVSELIFENKVVSAFVDACPGLEPAVLLGKLHWEATQGATPESQRPWKHVVVDAPSTGHSVMLFRSTAALMDVFSTGLILKQANEIVQFVRNPNKTKVYIVATPEELPLQEALELKANLEKEKMFCTSVLLNRCMEPVEAAPSASSLPEEWLQEWKLENEFVEDSLQLTDAFTKNLGNQVSVWRFPELSEVHAKSLELNMGPVLRSMLMSTRGRS